MTGSRRFALVTSITAITLGGVGCALGDAGQPGPGLAKALACAFDFDHTPTIDSDHAALRAIVDCEPDADCSDRRTVLVGSTFDFSIEAPMQPDGATLHVESTDTSVIHLDGYDSKPDACDDTVQLSGSVSFDRPGTGAVVVSAGGQEIDRFSISVHDADHVDIQAVEGVSFGSASGYESVDALAIDTPYSIRAVVRDAEGERLIGASRFRWWVSDPSVVLLDDNAASSKQLATLVPVAVGTTTLNVDVHGLRAEIPVDITGLREPAADAGLPEMN